MPKIIPSPSLSAPPEARFIRGVGDHPLHPLFSLAVEPIILPVRFNTVDDNLTTQQCGSRCWVERLSAGNLRLHHPYAPADQVAVLLASDVNASSVVNHTNAPLGYTDITLSTATAAWSGYVCLFGDKDTPKEQGTEHPNKSLAERTQLLAQAPMQGLALSFYGIAVDATGAPVPSTSFGALSFHVAHPSEGIYVFSTTTEFNSASTGLAMVDGLNAVATLGPALNQITVTTTALADPALNGLVQVLVLSPATKAGTGFQRDLNTSKPKLLGAHDGTYPAYGALRDLSFIPITFAVDGAGAINYASIDTVIPDNVTITKVGNDYRIEFGKCRLELFMAGFRASGTGGFFPIVRTEIETLGRITVTTGAQVSTVIRGVIVASFSSER